VAAARDRVRARQLQLIMSVAAKPSSRAHILVVEDSSVFREMQDLLLGQAGFAVSSHERPDAALAAAAKRHFDLVVIDYELPGMNGEEFMHRLRAIQPDIAVIFVSGALTIDLAIKLSNEGVAGIFNKPANPKTLLEKINETLFRAPRGSNSPLPAARCGTGDAPAYVPPQPTADQLAYPPRYVLGSSDAFREFTHRLWKVRDFRAVLLLQGEAGSPFELFARELAEISIFREGPVMVCDAVQFEARHLIKVLAPALLSTDAGTLVLTGVERFTAEQQTTLENLLNGRDVFGPFARRFRLVLAATNELSDGVDNGSFNDTLFYKISSLSLTVPSLRKMQGDILVNAERILQRHALAAGALTPFTLSPDAADWLATQDWVGNYEQLATTLALATQHAATPQLTLETFYIALRAPAPSSPPVAPASPFAAAPEPVAAVATAPAQFAPARDEQSDRPLAARSLFRAASNGYNFSQRLAESLATADACGAH
jgi:DNA-binding NtrC family response regulator